MIPFALAAAALALIALGLLTRPLWRRAPAAAPADGQAVAVAALRMQLTQLQSLSESGALGPAAYNEARTALERRLVDLVVAAPATAPAPRAPGARRLAGLLSLFVVGVALAGYAWLGAPQGLETGTRVAPTASAADGHPVTPEQIGSMVEGLAARLKERPDDAEGWAMLARSYAVLGRHDQALPAFRRALELRGDDASLLADHADALAVANDRRLDGEPERLIARALEIDPRHLKALSLAGTLAFDRRDYAGAVRHWEQMVRTDPGNELTQQIQGGIDEARLRLGGAAPPRPSAAGPGAATAAGISGTVSLAPALTARARPDDTVFVFARAAEGSRMPLAILRKQVRDLPFAFMLDDSQAMSPAARLSSATRVVVGARVSRSGGATPQAGDLQGLSAAVAPGASQLKLEIGDVVGR